MGTVKYTGSVASFHCPTNAEIRSLKVHFSPKQEGSGDPSPENVRSIVGWDGVEVYRNDSTTDYEFGVLGKNKYDYNSRDIFEEAAKDDNGNGIAAPTNSYDKHFTSVKPNTIYTISGVVTGIGYKRIYFYTENKEWISRSAYFITTSQTFTTPANCYFIQIQSDYTEVWSGIQLELGSTATAYEPYDPKHTVYGGWVDLISGEVCEEWGMKDLGTVNWSNTRLSSSDSIAFYSTISDMDTIKGIICTHYKSIGNSFIGNLNNNEICSYFVSSSGSNRLGIRDDNKETLSSADFKEAMLGVIVTYQFATPVTYYLAPTQLQTFLGQNNIWSNADYVEVEYDLYETQDILTRKQFIIANQPHIVSPAAAPLQNFVTNMAAPLKECKVHFAPKQDLHGYSNPWPAGGGKNIAKPYDNSYVSSTYVSFDYSAANGTFRCYGTASASSTHSSPSATNAANNGATFTLPAGTYTLSIINGDGTYIYAQCVSSTEIVLAETTSYTTFTTNEALTVFVRLKVAAGATVDNTVKIQLEAGSTATSYVPYENICSISGWTGVTGYRTGVNLWGGEKLADDIVARVPGASKDAVNRTVSYSGSNIAGKLLFNKFKPNTQYTVILHGTGVPNLKFIYSNGSSRTLGGSISGGKIFVSDGTKNLVHISGEWNTGNTTLNYDQCGVFEGNLGLSDFTPYTGTTYSVDWTDDVGTIYGGYVDLVNGELIATMDAVDVEWGQNYVSQTVYTNNTIRRFELSHNAAHNGSQGNTICDKATYLYAYGSDSTHFYTHGNAAYITMPNQTPSNEHIKVIYDLDTPISYQLTTTQLKTLRGTNNIWSNTNGDIRVKYWTH